MTNVIVSSKQARDNFSDLLGQVKFGQKVVTIQKQGKTYGVLISPEQYEAYKKAAKDNLFNIIEAIQARNAQYSEEEVIQDVTDTVDEVRKELYGQGK
ncbi:MAG: type II toxin-antitoxin system Phd/YefM family antitoxin [Patescibacteria group bacterium]|nr:type II toxin-antitoxin system Phd/YefM family antitoxin [Patescibacteria group bacterium]MDE2590006.1 type II toxin-antitoxin system Phd/YefM family antitoxin [Patescibacteria group bacterium]